MTHSRSTGRPSISRSVLADQVKEWLMGQILEGHYPTNARIVETAVARELGVSQAPVREALRGLEALGLIEIAPFQGARVRKLEASDLTEAYAVRASLEVLGARLAMARIDTAGVAAVLEKGKRLRAAARAKDTLAVAVADAELHEQIMKLSGNKTLLRVWRSLEPVSRTLLTMLVPEIDTDWTAHLHDGMLAAVEARDPDALAAAIQSHFDQAQARFEWHAHQTARGVHGADWENKTAQ